MRSGGLWLLLLVGLAAAFPEQFADPFIRSDDYPALFPNPERYYHKTLTEGRWVNWLWMLRSWPADPVVLHWVLAAAWALTAALVGTGIAPERGQWPAAALVAIAFLMMAPQAYIWLWFNTLIPGALLLMLWAGIVVFAPRRVAEWGLFAAVPLMLMAHTAFPFLALALVAGLSRPDPARRDILRLGAIFVIALALGLVFVYGLNWLIHGHFGVVAPGWREPNPIENWADLIQNLGAAGETLVQWLSASGATGALRVMLLVFTGTTALMLWLSAPRRGEAMLLALGLGLAVPAAHMTLTGVVWPFRASSHIAGAIILMAGLAFVRIDRTPARLLAALHLIALIFLGSLAFKGNLAGRGLDYQAAAAEIAAEAGTNGEDIVIVGQAHGLPGAEFLQFAVGLRARLEHLTGRKAYLCSPQAGDTVYDPVAYPSHVAARLDDLTAVFDDLAQSTRKVCASHAAAVDDLPHWPQSGYVSQIAPGITGVHLPERTLADTPP